MKREEVDEALGHCIAGLTIMAEHPGIPEAVREELVLAAYYVRGASLTASEISDWPVRSD